MALFSSTESTKSVVKDATKELAGATFKLWTFSVQDAEGNIYNWEDTEEHLLHASAPSWLQVSQYIHAYLTGGAKANGSGNYTGVTKIIAQVKPRGHITVEGLINQAPNSTPSDEAILDGETTYSAGTEYQDSDYNIRTFSTADATPSVTGGRVFNTDAGTLIITDFDDGYLGQEIWVFSKGAVTFDVTSSGLKGGSTNIVTANGDLTCWFYDGTDWWLTNFMDVTKDISGGY